MKKPITVFILFTIVIFFALAYQASAVYFLSDDWNIIPFHIKSLLQIVSSGWLEGTNDSNFYRPLTKFLLFIEYNLFKFNPKGYHVLQVFYHLIASGLIYYLTIGLFKDINKNIAIVSALIFFLLPIHTDNIFWIATRSDIICAIFYFTTLIFFLKYLDSNKSYFLVLTTVSFWLALLSKEMALTLIVILLLITFCKKSIISKKIIFFFSMLFISLLGYFILRYLLINNFYPNGVQTSFSFFGLFRSLAITHLGIFKLSHSYLSSLFIIIPLILIIISSLKKLVSCRDIIYLLIFFEISIMPLLGYAARWYLYIPSAFACIAFVYILFIVLNNNNFSKFLYLKIYIIMIIFGIILVREGKFWKEASIVSKNVLTSISRQINDAKDIINVINMPAAIEQSVSIGEKAIFANSFNQALKYTYGLTNNIEIINHIWLIKYLEPSSFLTKTEDKIFDIMYNENGFSSFHSKEFLLKSLIPVNTSISDTWGELKIFNPRHILLKLAGTNKNKVLFFNGVEFINLENK